jgi:hypothetical protein
VNPLAAGAASARWIDAALGGLAVGLAAIVYFPVTGAYFFADDVLFLMRLAAEPLREVLLEPFGGHLLLTRNAVFAATFALFGADPAPYYWSSFLTHLANVWLLFRLLCALTARPALACLVATLWGTCPVHIAAVGWYASYGHLLATTAMLVVLGQVARADPATPPSLRRVVWWCGILLMAATCFGVGVGVALVFPVVAVLLLPRLMRPTALAALLALPLTVAGLYRWVTRREPVAASMGMFQAIVLRSYPPIVIMLGHLLVYGATALAVGFFRAVGRWPYAATYPSTASRTVAAVFGTALVGAFWLGDPRRRRQLLAAATLALGVYGIVALGRAGFRSQDLAFWASQARYHYAGTIPLAMLLCLALRELGRRGPLRFLRPEALLAGWLAVGTIGWAQSSWRPESHAAARQEIEARLSEMDVEIDRAPAGSTVYLDNGTLSRAVRGPAIDQAGLPGRAALFVIMHPSDVVRGRHVRFVEPDAGVRAVQAARHGRLGSLLVAPEARAAGGLSEPR